MLLSVLQEEMMQYDLTRDHPEAVRRDHMRAGSVEELGEMAGLDKRALRDGTEPSRDQLRKEFGDRLWYLVGEIDAAGFCLDDVARANLEKLADRKSRGVIQGKGDNR